MRPQRSRRGNTWETNEVAEHARMRGRCRPYADGVEPAPEAGSSAADVRLADVTLIGLVQFVRARRLHVVTDRPELERAEVQRFLLISAQLPAVRLCRDVAGHVGLAQRLV